MRGVLALRSGELMLIAGVGPHDRPRATGLMLNSEQGALIFSERPQPSAEVTDVFC